MSIIETTYATDVRKSRRSGTQGSQEFFTPSVLVNKMLDMLPDYTWTDFTKTIVEPSAGNGNFVIACIERRLAHAKTQEDVEKAVGTIFSVELMSDNVDEQKARTRDLLHKYGYSVTKKIEDIMEYNFVCSDFFEWDFVNWCKIKNINEKSYALF